MKIFLNEKIYNEHGKVLESKDKDPVTLGHLMRSAMCSAHDTQKINGQEKSSRYKTWKIINKAILGKQDYVDLDIKVVEKIKSIIGDIFATIVSGQAWELLENNGRTEEDK